MNSLALHEANAKPDLARFTSPAVLEALNAGAIQDTLDLALAPIQIAAGITSGDFAAQHFSGSDADEQWASWGYNRRRDCLAAYIEAERRFAESHSTQG